MKLFGDFLIDRQAITEQQLLAALIIQMKQQPTLCELAVNENVLDTKALLTILTEQSRKRSGFVEAAQSLGLWNDSIAKKLDVALTKSRPPLGKILAAQGSLSWTAVSKLLDEFWNELEASDIQSQNHTSAEPKVTPHETAVEVEPKPEPELVAKGGSSEMDLSHTAEPSASVSSEELVEVKPAGIESESKIESYLEVFSEFKKGEIEGILHIIKDWTTWNKPTQEPLLKSLKDSVHVLRGGARFSMFPSSEAIFSKIEESLEEIPNQEANFSEKFFINFSEIILSGFELAWKLRTNLMNEKQENGDLTKVDELQNALKNLMTDTAATEPKKEYL